MQCRKVCAENGEEITLFWFSKLRKRGHKKGIYQVMTEFHSSNECLICIAIAIVTAVCIENQVWVLK